MNYYFLDTSAYVKALACEPGEKRVRDLIHMAVADPPSCRVIVCDFILPEVTSALLQLRERRAITRGELGQALAEVEKHVGGYPSPFIVIESSGVMTDSTGIVRQYGLRPGDAIHLAAALAAKYAAPAGVNLYLVTTDENQSATARAEGFTVLDPLEDEMLPPDG